MQMHPQAQQEFGNEKGLVAVTQDERNELKAAIEKINQMEPPAATEESEFTTLKEWRGLCRDQARAARAALEVLKGIK